MLSLELTRILRGLYFGYSVYIIDSGLLWKRAMVHIIDILSPINILIPSRNILKCLFVTINIIHTLWYTLAKVNLKQCILIHILLWFLMFWLIFIVMQIGYKSNVFSKVIPIWQKSHQMSFGIFHNPLSLKVFKKFSK